jgi:signal transduction histidine kinase
VYREPPARAFRSERGAARALLELSRTATGDWSASIRHIVQFDAEALQVERVNFWAVSEEGSSMHCEAGYVSGSHIFERGATLFEPDSPEYFAALREARILNMEDVTTDPRCGGLRDYCAARGISSMLDMPVCVEGRLAGVLCHEHVGAARRWTEREEDFAMGAAQVVASALAARAHTQSEATAQRAAFLDNVSRVVLQTLDLREVARRAASLVVPKLADVAVVWMLNRDNVFEWLAVNHADPGKRELLAQAARDTTASGRRPALPSLIVRQKQSLLIPDVTPAVLERYSIPEAQRALFDKLAIRSGIGVPLAVAEKTFGAMILLTVGRRYGGEDLELAEEVGDRVGWALENARLYAIAREAIHARDDFLLLASHELRTPLTALQLLAEDALRRGHRSGDAREEKRCQTIVHQVYRLGSLVERMLEALQIRSEGVVLNRQSCDLASIVEGVVADVGERATRAGCAIALLARPGAVARWDRPRLQRAVFELLDNAIKFGANGPIEVHLDQKATHVALTVRDHGPGIAADRLPSIFLPFERAVSKEHFGGLGLGLTIAKTIVEAHGGSISAASRAGDGATFVVRLPLADGHAGPTSR